MRSSRRGTEAETHATRLALVSVALVLAVVAVVGAEPRTVDVGGVVLDVAGQAYRSTDLDDPAVSSPDETTIPLPAGDYRAAGVLSTEAGYLVTPLVPIRVE